MTNLTYVKNTLISGGYTCVMCKGEDKHTSNLRGVKPLVQFVESGASFDGYSAADKVVGRATAFLYVILGVKEIYAAIISQPALEILTAHNIYVEYDTKVSNIINRTGDGICPFEAAVMSINNSDDAYSAILSKMQELGISL